MTEQQTADPPGALTTGVRALETGVRWVSRAALAVSALVLLSIFLLISYAVGMRYFAGRPLPWTDEAVGWLLVASVMMAIPDVQRRGDHIGIDFFASKLGDGKRRWLLVFGVATVVASAIIFVREGIEMVMFSRMLDVLSNQIPEVPLWLVQASVPVGFALLLLVALTQLLVLLVGLKPYDMSEHMKEDV